MIGERKGGVHFLNASSEFRIKTLQIHIIITDTHYILDSLEVVVGFYSAPQFNSIINLILIPQSLAFTVSGIKRDLQEEEDIN